jgi:hypothetical protein
MEGGNFSREWYQLKGLASELTQMVFFSKFKWPSPFQHKKVSFSELMPGEYTAVAITFAGSLLLVSAVGTPLLRTGA